MSEDCSVGSEFSSHTLFTHHPAEPRHRLQKPSNQGSKRGFDPTEEQCEDLTPSKRAASCRHDDLSCLEATIFDRCPDSADRMVLEVESRWLQGQMPTTCSADLAAMLRVAYRAENYGLPDPNYMERHGQAAQVTQFLEPNMRSVAVSWLVEVAAEFALQQETLFLGVSLLDCFLSHTKAVPRNQLQLTAVTCVMIAAKHEENSRVPSARDFTHIADNCFKVSDLLRMESLVLQTLRFRIMKPTAFSLHCLLCTILSPTQREAALAMYLTELAMLEYRMLRFRPSMIAASAILLAQADRLCLEGLESLAEVAAYPLAALQECCEELCALQVQAFDAVDAYNPLMAVKDKYRDLRWHCVSVEAPLNAAAIWGDVTAAVRI